MDERGSFPSPSSTDLEQEIGRGAFGEPSSTEYDFEQESIVERGEFGESVSTEDDFEQEPVSERGTFGTSGSTVEVATQRGSFQAPPSAVLRALTPSTYVPLSPLEYTINRLIEQHLIQIERDTAAKDPYGAEGKRAWALHATIEGLFWWWPTHGAGRFVEEATPQRAVDITGGGCLFPIGTDVTEFDRIGNIKDPDGNLEVEGPFRIVSLRRLPTHVEISVERP